MSEFRESTIGTFKVVYIIKRNNHDYKADICTNLYALC